MVGLRAWCGVCLALVLALAVACGSVTPAKDAGHGDGDTDTDSDTGSVTDTGTGTETEEDPPEAIDLLFVVDDSHSMGEEQGFLTANVPGLVLALTDPPDLDRNGVPDYPAVSDLHIGVVSTDMGTADVDVEVCSGPGNGDDGVLQHSPSNLVADCEPSYPAFLTYESRHPDETIGKAFECIATLGTEGCGFEQPLAAFEKGLTEHAADGAPNEGFLRPEALLGIVILSDEDDCSVDGPDIFADDPKLGPLVWRCHNNPGLLRSVEGFVTSAIDLKPDHPEHVLVLAIVGVPPPLVVLTDEDLRSGDIQTTEDFDEILDDPEMQEVMAKDGSGLVPSCDTDFGFAYPPRRIVEFVRDVDRAGNGGVVQSICAENWAPAMAALTQLVRDRLAP